MKIDPRFFRIRFFTAIVIAMNFFKRDLVENTNNNLAGCRADVVAMPYAQNSLPGFALQEQRSPGTDNPGQKDIQNFHFPGGTLLITILSGRGNKISSIRI
jgi:hypothetical protein